MRHILIHIFHLILFALFSPLLSTYVLFDVLVVAPKEANAGS
jgi:hypothetical protein